MIRYIVGTHILNLFGGMLLKFKRHKVVLGKSQKEMGKPRHVVRENLFCRSVSDDFDEARQEWDMETVIDETCDGFSGTCELCHTTGLKYNFVLKNHHTGHTLQVGTSCIVRFGIAQRGAVSVESGVTFLQNVIDEQYYKNIIQTHTKDMMVLHPNAKDMRAFLDALRKYFHLRGIKNPSDEHLGDLMFGPHWMDQDVFKRRRMRDLWDRPGMIEPKKPEKIRFTPNPKEHTTFGYKNRARAFTSLSPSELYNVERYIVESDMRR